MVELACSGFPSTTATACHVLSACLRMRPRHVPSVIGRGAHRGRCHAPAAAAARRAPMPAPPCLPALAPASRGGTRGFGRALSVVAVVRADVTPFLPSPCQGRRTPTLQRLCCAASPWCDPSSSGLGYGGHHQGGKEPPLRRALLLGGLDQAQPQVSSHHCILKPTDFVSPVAAPWQLEASAHSTRFRPLPARCKAEPVLRAGTANCRVFLTVVPH